MTNSPRTRRTLPTWAPLLILPLAGCFGPSDDKGDNGDSKLFTPKPSKVEDANTAGERKTILPVPEKSDAKPGEPADAKAPEPAIKPPDSPTAEPK